MMCTASAFRKDAVPKGNQVIEKDEWENENKQNKKKGSCHPCEEYNEECVRGILCKPCIDNKQQCFLPVKVEGARKTHVPPQFKCTSCRRGKYACNGQQPCQWCIKKGKKCLKESSKKPYTAKKWKFSITDNEKCTFCYHHPDMICNRVKPKCRHCSKQNILCLPQNWKTQFKCTTCKWQHHHYLRGKPCNNCVHQNHHCCWDTEDRHTSIYFLPKEKQNSREFNSQDPKSQACLFCIAKVHKKHHNLIHYDRKIPCNNCKVQVAILKKVQQEHMKTYDTCIYHDQGGIIWSYQFWSENIQPNSKRKKMSKNDNVTKDNEASDWKMFSDTKESMKKEIKKASKGCKSRIKRKIIFSDDNSEKVMETALKGQKSRIKSKKTFIADNASKDNKDSEWEDFSDVKENTKSKMEKAIKKLKRLKPAIDSTLMTLEFFRGAKTFSDILQSTMWESDTMMENSHLHVGLMKKHCDWSSVFTIMISKALNNPTLWSTEPRTFHLTMKTNEGPLWKAAVKDEYNSLLKNKVWEVVDHPSSQKVFTERWVFKHKISADGSIAKHKAWFVVRDFEQIFEIDFDKTFTSVVKSSFYHLFFALAALFQWTVKQYNIKTAFLNGDVDELIYIKPPERFSEADDKVLRLLKLLYELKQEPRNWY